MLLPGLASGLFTRDDAAAVPRARGLGASGSLLGGPTATDEVVQLDDGSGGERVDIELNLVVGLYCQLQPPQKPAILNSPRPDR